MDIVGKCGVLLWISWVNVEHYGGYLWLTAQHHDGRILVVYTLKYSTERFVGFYNNSIREEGGGGGCDCDYRCWMLVTC